jgi:uncharacterized protein
MQVLAAALGWPSETINLSFRSDALSNMAGFVLGNLTKAARVLLAGPPPDLVLSAESRASSVATWLKQRSGGKIKTVCMTRPKGKLSGFDLIITTPQYELPHLPNILEISLPLTAVAPPVSLAEDGSVTVALLVGGTSAPYRLDAGATEAMIQDVIGFVARLNGTLVVATSSRTGREAEELLAEKLHLRSQVCLWSDGARHNRYADILATSDMLIVTSDSVSMLADAIGTGKPTFIYDLPSRKTVEDALVRQLWARYIHQPATIAGRLAAPLFESGLIEPRANRAALHERLINAGLLRRFGDAPHLPSPLPFAKDTDMAVTAVRQLF